MQIDTATGLAGDGRTHYVSESGHNRALLLRFANCGQGIEGFALLCSRMKAATELPIWIKANAGLPELVDGATVFRTTAPQFADQVPAVVEAGASFVGGCCGTTPDFIRETANRIC